MVCHFPVPVNSVLTCHFPSNYNYELDNGGVCSLVEGEKPLTGKEMCANDPNLRYYKEGTSYRRIPITTCQGGKMLDAAEETLCPGQEPDPEKENKGLSGLGLFVVAVLLPFLVASGVGYWVWRNWDGKFGRIRLGDTGSAFDASQPWIQYPVAAISALVAVVAAIPLVASSAWRGISGMFGGGRRYTTRQSFARGRGDYAVVDPDEDELLGDDEEEDV